MAEEAQQIPFLKQLVDSADVPAAFSIAALASARDKPRLTPLDRKVRDRAVVALESYLSSGRTFSRLELLKLWRGLYFAMYHTPLARSGPLTSSITSLVSSLPPALFLPFGSAFWLTVAEQHPQLDAHRVDKYLMLMRRYLRAQLAYLNAHGWDPQLLDGFVRQMTEQKTGPLGVGGTDEVVGDGVRYHMLDVWLDEVEKAVEQMDAHGEDQRRQVVKELRAVPQGLADSGRSKVLRSRASEVVEDDRWSELEEGTQGVGE